MNSSGLNVMINVLTKSRKAGGEVAIANVTKKIKELLIITKLNSFFNVSESIDEAFAKYGLPRIVNTDQGSQFTATEFTDAVLSRSVLLSMDGKGAWRDNVFVERVWRSVKYEEVYLKAYDSVSHARRAIGNYLNWYNQNRPHSRLADKTPDEAYFATLPAIKSAA